MATTTEQTETETAPAEDIPPRGGKKRKIGPLGCLMGCGGLLMFFCLCPVGGYLIFESVGRGRMAAEMNKIREKGEPVTVSDLDTYYVVAPGYEDTTALWMSINQVYDTPAFQEDCTPLPIIGGEGPQEIPPPSLGWKEQAMVEAFLKKYKSTLDKIHEATSKGGRARFPRKFADGFAMLLPQVQNMRQTSRLLTLELYVKAHQGEMEGVMKTLRAMFTAGRALENDVTLVSQLVQIAMDNIAVNNLVAILPHLEFTDTQLVELQKIVRQFNYRQSMKAGLIGERTLGMQAIKNPASLDASMTVPARGEDIALYLHTLSRMVDACEQPWPQMLDESEKVEADMQAAINTPAGRFRFIYTTLLAPAVSAAGNAGARSQAVMHMVDALLACQRFKLANDSYPKTLEELVPGELPTVPTDPFDGKPLRYEIRDGHPYLWSIGQDRTDNNGECYKDTMAPDIAVTLDPSGLPQQDEE